ncbi:hypothetical protein SESBI_35888 [Sesbania bispinosa]|nr:hypothetical protein SESBI_35888 [Sesbania bispinosa]
MAMVSAGFHPISNVCGRRESWRLKVKVIRVWNMAAIATPHDPYALQMLLLDEEGTLIEGTVQKANMQRFSAMIVEGLVYKITNFNVIKNGGSFRATRHDHKILFTVNTKVICCENVCIPSLGLSLKKTDEILKTNGFSEYLLDFMGILSAVSEEIIMVKGEMQKRLVLLDLVDEMGEVKLAVFGDMVDVVLDLVSQPRIGLPVLIIQLAKVNFYKGQVGIQNVMNATKIWWNPDIPLAVDFKNSLAVHEIETDVEVRVITPRPRPVSASDEFLKLYPKKRVGELYELTEEGSFIIIGNIMEVVHDGDWWYMACSCMRAVKYGHGMPFCDECKTIVYDLTPRYKIKVMVSDGSDSAHLLMWDNECYSLITRSCRDLLAISKGKPSKQYPNEILALVGKEVLFKVEVKHDDSDNLDDSFKVKSVCTDCMIINEYKEDVDDQTPLKLKFAPAFSKMVDNDKTSCVIEISPLSTSAITEVDVTPKSEAISSSSVDKSLVLTKRDGQPSVDAAQGRGKRGKFRNVKLE